MMDLPEQIDPSRGIHRPCSRRPQNGLGLTNLGYGAPMCASVSPCRQSPIEVNVARRDQLSDCRQTYYCSPRCRTISRSCSARYATSSRRFHCQRKNATSFWRIARSIGPPAKNDRVWGCLREARSGGQASTAVATGGRRAWACSVKILTIISSSSNRKPSVCAAAMKCCITSAFFNDVLGLVCPHWRADASRSGSYLLPTTPRRYVSRSSSNTANRSFAVVDGKSTT